MKTSPDSSGLLRAKRSSLLVALAALSLAGCGGSGTGSGSSTAAPKITKQPSSTAAAPGSSVTLQVSASGGSGLTYQWSRGTSPISGATSSSYTIEALSTGDYGTYSVTVTNEFGSTTSAVATLSQPDTGAPKITSQPSSLAVAAGGSATFTVVATGDGTLGYQWYKNGKAIVGATDASYTIPTVGASDAATYFVRITNDNGTTPLPTTNSASVTLSIASASVPVITSQPGTTVDINAGATYTFTVVASGKPTLTYQWYKGSTTIVGATGPTYRISAASESDSGEYHVVVTNDLGSATSTPTTLTVYVPPTITSAPTSQTAYAGTTVSFHVGATGTNLTYQWYRGTTKLSGETSSTLAISSATTSDADSYYVVVSNRAGTVSTDPVTLTVYGKPVITDQPASKTIGENQTATFSVTATGQGSLGYQWFKNGTAIGGANGTSYVTPTEPLTDTGATFYVEVTNPAGTTRSNTATLTVVAAPTITIQPSPSAQTVAAGTNVTYSVTATASGNLTYQWYKGGNAISGETSNTLTLSSVTSANTGTYYVVVTNAGVIGKQSSTVTLTVS